MQLVIWVCTTRIRWNQSDTEAIDPSVIRDHTALYWRDFVFKKKPHKREPNKGPTQDQS